MELDCANKNSETILTITVVKRIHYISHIRAILNQEKQNTKVTEQIHKI